MTKTAMTILAGLALATSAQAGEDYSAKAPAPIPAPACGWNWFAGGSVGYLVDMDTEMYTLHVGMEHKCAGSQGSHAIYLEGGYAKADGFGLAEYRGSSTPLDDHKFDVDTDIVPLTLNYKYENVLAGSLNWYIGAGAGVAFVDASHNGSDWNGTHDIADQFSDAEFFGQIFGGLVYNISESFELFSGVRYIYMNDDKDFDTYGDDFMVELGARFNF